MFSGCLRHFPLILANQILLREDCVTHIINLHVKSQTSRTCFEPAAVGIARIRFEALSSTKILSQQWRDRLKTDPHTPTLSPI